MSTKEFFIGTSFSIYPEGIGRREVVVIRNK
jgi:hypothetical protein